MTSYVILPSAKVAELCEQKLAWIKKQRRAHVSHCLAFHNQERAALHEREERLCHAFIVAAELIPEMHVSIDDLGVISFSEES